MKCIGMDTEINVTVSQKCKHRLNYDPTAVLLDIYSRS